MKHMLPLLIIALFAPPALLGQSLETSPPATYSVKAEQASAPAIEVTEWTLPRAQARPRDTFVSTRGGFVWYSDTAANILGRFDPKTGKFDEYRLRPGSDPFGFVEHYGSGVQTTVYFTSRTGAFIGEFDLNTREVREFRLEGGGAILRDLTFDPNGDIWFTVAQGALAKSQQGSKLGHINLFSANIRLLDLPTRGASAHAVAVNSVGIPFFTERDSPRLGSVHPMTMKVTEYALPNAKSGARGLAITPDDIVWYTDHLRGYLGRFDPNAARFQEWASPGGANGRPSAIAAAGKMLWYIEGGPTQRLVRFDPATTQFQSWILKSTGEVEHLYAHPDGSLWFAVPGTNRIARVGAANNKDK